MRVVVCGEALIDLIPSAANETKEALEVSQVSDWQASSGGSPLNTSVAMARLGMKPAFLGRISWDGLGRQLHTWLTLNGVDLDLAIRAPEPTSIGVVSKNPDGSANYAFLLEGTANFLWSADEFPTLSEGDWLHFGSLIPMYPPGREELLKFVANCPADMSYDLNIRPTILPDRAVYWDRVEPFMRIVGERGGILRASDQDIAWLTNADENDPDFDPVEVGQMWAADYGALVVITLGAAGAVAIKPDGRVYQTSGVSIEVQDTVGAGDTFTAGFLDSWLSDPSDMDKALARGAAAAAITCSRVGANPPTNAEVDQLLASLG